MLASPRMRRLANDAKALEQLRCESSIFTYTGYGNPPDAYRIYFRGRGLGRPEGCNTPQVCDAHEVSISLGATYPRTLPGLRWETPIFHPNVSATGVVCLGGFGTFWTPALTLDRLCEMLWDMLRYANYDAVSAYNRAAADWTKQQPRGRFPLDDRELRDRRPVPLATQTDTIAFAAPFPGRTVNFEELVVATLAPPAPAPEPEIVFLD